VVGGDALWQQATAQQSVEKGAFASVEFSDNHQQEKLVQLLGALFEQFQVSIWRIQLGQLHAQIVQK
jgi:hypothetical protein